MKTRIFLFSLVILGLFSASCSKESDIALTETIFIQDPYYPGLPIYSEWGYNTFGAYIDRKPFVSNNYDLPAKIYVNTDTLHLLLRGKMGSQDVDLKFSIKGYSPANYEELTVLDNTTINLKEEGRAVVLKMGGVSTNLQIIEGEIEIKRVQRLYIDQESMRTIMSGYFRLKTFWNGEPISISNGRFDLGIGYENFYNF